MITTPIELITREEAAAIAKVHPSTIDKAIRAKVLTKRNTGRNVRILVSDLVKWLGGSEILTREEAAALVRVHVCTIDKAIRQKQLAVVKIGRVVRISRQALDAWINA